MSSHWLDKNTHNNNNKYWGNIPNNHIAVLVCRINKYHIITLVSKIIILMEKVEAHVQFMLQFYFIIEL